MNEINVNGQLKKADVFFAGRDHRGLKYGDGLFESIRMLDGKMPLLNDHLRRLYKGMKFLKIEKPNYFNAAFFRKEIKKITRSEKQARIRLSIFRKPGGLYTPMDNHPTYLIEYQPIKIQKWSWLKEGLVIDLCPSISLPITPWSGLKTANSLPYVLAGLWKKEQNLDDCLLLNQAGFIAEASSSNLFYFKDKTLFTPTDQSGAILGVMRSHIIKLAKNSGLSVIKKEVKLFDLLEADEVFLTNAIQGIRWVKDLRGVRFKNRRTKQIWRWL